MSELEHLILDIIQDGFPIEERPYAVLADIVRSYYSRINRDCHSRRSAEHVVEGSSITEQSVFDIVERLRSFGIIRRIGGVYDSKKLGYTSRLCCGIVPETSTDGGESPIDQFAAVVNEIPAITHNYIRSHRYNVWFTVIGKSEQEIQNVVCNLERKTALTDTHILNASRMFKINTVMLSKKSNQDQVHELRAGAEHLKVPELRASAEYLKVPELSRGDGLSPFDWARIRLLCGDIPHTLTPFTQVAEQLVGSAEGALADVFAGIRDDLATKRMRRFGCILRHQQAGFAENAMVCLKYDSDLVPAMGSLLAAEPFVSHCYERNAFEGFDYNVYAMVHASSLDDLNAKIQLLVQKTGNPEYNVLRSVRELKKTSFNF